MKTTAAVLNELGAELSLEHVQLDGPRPDEVLVQIAAVGICHTDIATRDGALPFPLPAVLGHEGSGTVVSAGSDVTKVRPGDRVAISFATCGRCPACAAGSPSYCHGFMALNYAGTRPDGSSVITNAAGNVGGSFFGQSSFAAHAITSERNLVKVPDDFPLELAGPLGCGIQTGAGAIMRSFSAPAGSGVLIIGGGSVGLSAVLGAAVQGCDPIIVAEPVPGRRELARTLGATHAIDPADGPAAEQVRALFPAGVQFALDTTGLVPAISGALGALGNQGVLGLLAIPADPAAALPVPLLQGLVLGLTVKNIIEGDSDTDTFIPQLMQLYLDDRFPFDKLITTLPFEKINDGMAAQLSGEAVKVVLLLDQAG
jgi:aryl-alcohol dehydrogenase